MPHTIIHTNEAGRSALASLGLTAEDFAAIAEGIVAVVFHEELGEELHPGDTVKTDGIFESETMPVDIHLTVLAWCSVIRMQYQPRLRANIGRRLNEFFTLRGVGVEDAPHTQAHLNMVGLATD